MEAVRVQVLHDKFRDRPHGGVKIDFTQLREQVFLQGFVMMQDALDKVAMLVAFLVAARANCPDSGGGGANIAIA